MGLMRIIEPGGPEIFDIELENVGNLICRGGFPLGAHKRLVVTSVTEGPCRLGESHESESFPVGKGCQKDQRSCSLC